MKTIKILSILISLAFSIVVGGIISQVSGMELMAFGANILPHVSSTVLFGLSFIPLTPLGSLGVYVAVSVTKPGTNMGVGGGLYDEIVFFDMDTVDKSNFPQRDASGIKMAAGNIAFLSGATMITVYSTPGSIENTSKSQGDPDAKGFIQGCKFLHPGNEQAIREFRANWLNKNVGIIHRKCSDASKMDIYGTPCVPLQMQVTWTQNKDKNFNEFIFESLGVGYDVGIYEGALTLDTGSGSGA